MNLIDQLWALADNLFNMWEEAYFGSDAGGGGGLFNWKNWPHAG